jgi:hypothetical protein
LISINECIYDALDTSGNIGMDSRLRKPEDLVSSAPEVTILLSVSLDHFGK